MREKPNILNRRFVYVPSASTDLRATFARINPKWNKKPRRPRKQEPRQ